MMQRLVVGVAAAMLFTAGCSIDPAISDTGYVGTWSRGNLRVRSTIAIAKVGDEYRFRWAKRSTDGRLKIVCDWDGTCTESLDGNKTAEYVFRAWMDSKTGHLFVEAVETRTQPTVFSQRFTDELVVTKGGKELWSYTIEKNGDHFEVGKGTQRSFDKVADGVADPPKPAPTAG